MQEFTALLIKEGVSDVGKSGISKEYSTEALQNLADSIDRVPVVESFITPNSESYGEVTDAEYIDGEGLQCTVKIFDESIAEQIEDGFAELAPRLRHEPVDSPESQCFIEDVQLEAVFPTTATTDHVGKIEKV